jgi:hypothetical protein
MIGSYRMDRFHEGELFQLWLPGPIHGILPQTVPSHLWQ